VESTLFRQVMVLRSTRWRNKRNRRKRCWN